MPAIRSHARRLDQFYTQRPLAIRLVRLAEEHLGSQVGAWIEPSAGDGAFLDALTQSSARPRPVLALDLHPARPDIECADFLTWSPPIASTNPVAYGLLGNPPFGKNASLAVRFFNHAAPFVQGIAMIFPRTFQKRALQNRLDRRFALVCEQVLPADSFVFEGGPVAVPCVFQIWARLPEGQQRSLHAIARTHPDFAFVTRGQADFAFQRVGVAAGAIKASDAPVATESHLFVRVTDRSMVDQVRQRFQDLDWSAVKYLTAGNPSIGKGEIVQAYQTQTPP